MALQKELQEQAFQIVINNMLEGLDNTLSAVAGILPALAVSRNENRRPLLRELAVKYERIVAYKWEEYYRVRVAADEARERFYEMTAYWDDRPAGIYHTLMRRMLQTKPGATLSGRLCDCSHGLGSAHTGRVSSKVTRTIIITLLASRCTVPASSCASWRSGVACRTEDALLQEIAGAVRLRRFRSLWGAVTLLGECRKSCALPELPASLQAWR